MTLLTRYSREENELSQELVGLPAEIKRKRNFFGDLAGLEKFCTSYVKREDFCCSNVSHEDFQAKGPSPPAKEKIEVWTSQSSLYSNGLNKVKWRHGRKRARKQY